MNSRGRHLRFMAMCVLISFYVVSLWVREIGNIVKKGREKFQISR